VVANGQGEMKGKLFRMAHIGYYDYLDTIGGLAALEHVLGQVSGKPVEFGSAVRAAQECTHGKPNGRRCGLAGLPSSARKAARMDAVCTATSAAAGVGCGLVDRNPWPEFHSPGKSNRQ